MIKKEQLSLDHIKPHNTLHSTTENVLSSNMPPDMFDGELENNVMNSYLTDENVIK